MSGQTLKGLIVGHDVGAIVREAIAARRAGDEARASQLLRSERERASHVAREYARSVTRIDTPDE